MALVLTRRPLQSFTIGDDIKITLVEITNGGKQARIAIAAPKHLAIKRDDIVNNKPKKVGG